MQSWINSQNKYIEELSEEERYLLIQYSDDGNIVLKNNVLNRIDWDDFYERMKFKSMYFYETIITKLSEYITINYYSLNNRLKYLIEKDDILSQELSTIREFIKMYTDMFSIEVYNQILYEIQRDINSIIENSPPLSANLTVYRGTEDPYFINEKDEYVSPTIVSTSLHKSVAAEFINKTSGCCLKRITLKKGITCLYIESITAVEGENEILLPSGVKFKMMNLRERLTTSVWNKDRMIKMYSLIVQ